MFCEIHNKVSPRVSQDESVSYDPILQLLWQYRQVPEECGGSRLQRNSCWIRIVDMQIQMDRFGPVQSATNFRTSGPLIRDFYEPPKFGADCRCEYVALL